MLDKFSRQVNSLASGVYEQIAKIKLNRVHTPVSSVAIAIIIAIGVVLTIRETGGFQPIELVTYDWMMRNRWYNPGLDDRLLLVKITETDIQTQQKWPLSDRVVAQVLEEIAKFEPAVIGLDLYRDVPQSPGHHDLQLQLQSLDSVIGITKLSDAQEPGVPPPPHLPSEAVGFNDIVNDPDGIARRNLLFAQDQEGNTFYSFALRVALKYLSDRDIAIDNSPTHPQGIVLGKALITPLESHSGGYQTIDAEGYQILLNYRSPGSISQEVTLNQILNREVDPSWVKDKIVLIGTTASSEKDLFFTPYGIQTETETFKMPGVRVHAQMVSQLLSSALDGKPIFWFLPNWMEILWIVSCGVIGGLVPWQIQHPLKLGLRVILGVGGIITIGFGLFHGGGWIPMAAPTVAFMIALSGVVASKLLYTAFHDDLTGLPNRAAFMNELDRAYRRSQPKTLPFFLTLGKLPQTLPEKKPAVVSLDSKLPPVPRLLAVLFLDLDRFKIINDGLGHDMGDLLLMAIAERIRTLMRQPQPNGIEAVTIARVGGDEFAILLDNLYRSEDAINMGEFLYRQIARPFTLKGQDIYTTTSIGLALGRADDSRNLLRDAHTAMYRAKALTKARPQVFESAMQNNAVARFQLETDLRRAINAGATPVNGKIESEFLVYYQPLIDLKSGKIIGFEALVRWQHPERGLVFPGEFIPVAEETGSIVPLGELVLVIACWQICKWQEEFPQSPPLMVSVNLSGKQFAQPNLIEVVQRILDQTNLDPACLKLEITESVVMDEVEVAIEMLSQMKALNLKLGIDDFGTGYSSLSYLHRFPTDTLKVDRSFVMRMVEGDQNSAIVKTIIALAHNLKMDVIAEGVETAEQLAQLRSLGCECGQGYFFAKPLPAEQIEALLKSDPTW
ncbi:EAL domain-containing protein [Oscillatoria acuminata]|uniref:Diguanylate cyclase (GGDEF) domain-containing protein n=1 Tax=Oscillatoria acuminata PCC 6304 TaxID=56110 RepID=K9THT4_9CYAN|nr:EAL domain-containing protein [Oscillatoria acuminata]AFY81958.1 diguanylate cyclase (GGDEF) domain-containing protein [Oscillatoria acuminata PCC 6304]